MTSNDQAQQGTALLWSDEDLVEFAEQNSNDPAVRAVVRGALLYMRSQWAADRQRLAAEVARLTAELAEAKRWAPNVMSYETGVFSTLIATANAPGEDEAWAHLQDDDTSSSAGVPSEEVLRFIRWFLNAHAFHLSFDRAYMAAHPEEVAAYKETLAWLKAQGADDGATQNV